MWRIFEVPFESDEISQLFRFMFALIALSASIYSNEDLGRSPCGSLVQTRTWTAQDMQNKNWLETQYYSYPLYHKGIR